MLYVMDAGVAVMWCIPAAMSRRGLRYTSHGSSASNDMVLRTSPVVNARQERVPGVQCRHAPCRQTPAE